MTPMETMLNPCTLCPRTCGVNRYTNVGYCGAGEMVEVSKIMLHQWEEPCISGCPSDTGCGTGNPTERGKSPTRGSGAVFFTHCPLGCIYCQNRHISGRHAKGETLTAHTLARRFLALQEMGAYNLNLVTPTHYTPQIIEAVRLARTHGMTLPVVWNTGGYERPETIALLRGTVDIFLTDVKYSSPAIAKAFSHAPDYPETALRALHTMVDMVGTPAYDEKGMMTRGVIVRHLVLPGCREDSVAVLREIAAAVSPKDVVLSLMSQYTPEFFTLPEDVSPEVKKLGRRITSFEYDYVANEAIRLGFDGYFQERTSASSRYTPEF